MELNKEECFTLLRWIDLLMVDNNNGFPDHKDFDLMIRIEEKYYKEYSLEKKTDDKIQQS